MRLAYAEPHHGTPAVRVGGCAAKYDAVRMDGEPLNVPRCAGPRLG